jgi:hypothetical protein
LYKILKGEINPLGKLPIDRRLKYAWLFRNWKK